VGACLLCFAVAAIATLSATELVRVLALRLGACDQPGGRRVHRRPTARLGGLGIFWGFGVALLLAVYTGSDARDAVARGGMGMLGLFAGCGLMLITGLLDDVRGLSAPVKLGVQLAAATCVWWSGWRVETIGLPGVGAVAAGALSLPLTIGWIVFATNAVNLIDGLDGLASGLALVAALGVLAVVGPGVGSGVIAAVLAGALVGFLWFNVPPALIFMGDAGSLFVGFAVATLTLRGAIRSGPEMFPVLPLLLLAIPLTDAASAVVRRLVGAVRAAGSARELVHEARTRVMAPDRGHLHHRLLDAGLPAKLASLALQLSALPFALAASLIVRAPAAGWVVAALSAAGAALLWRFVHARAAAVAAGEPDVGTAAIATLEHVDDAWPEREAA